MQPARPIRGARKVARLEGCAREKVEHQAIYCTALALHHVIDQRITPGLVGMEKATGQIKAVAGEHLPALAFQARIGILQDRLPRRHGMPTVPVRRKWAGPLPN
jgi:hypothetical protein